MSVLSTLAKVAVGVAIAKGVGAMMERSRSGQSGSVPDGGLLGGAGRAPGGATSSLEEIMKSALGGGSGSAGTATGGLGGLLEQLGATKGSATGSAGGGLGDILSQISKGGLGEALGGLVGGLAGGAQTPSGSNKSFGELFNQSIGSMGEPEVAPSPDQEATAALLLRAMIQAAKADGKLDAAEQKKLLDNLKDASPAEMKFVQSELDAPVNIQALAQLVPKGLELQVYTMSVMAIDLDSRAEAEYLHKLATELAIDPTNVNEVHARLGVPALYS